MAFTKKSEANGRFSVLSETKTLPSGASVGYTSEWSAQDIGPDLSNNNRYVTFVCQPTTIDGTNLDITLHGAWTSGGTKVQLLDAPVADLTANNTAVAGVVDLNAYPAPYYNIGFLPDADESDSTITVRIIAANPDL